jgi:hypothetical protein
MSLLLNEPDFYYTSILNEETLNSSIINLNGVSGVLKGVNDAIQGSSTTDDLPEGKTNQYFTNARAQGAFTGGSGIVITSGTISNSGVLSLTGTANRITVSGSTGNITLSGPQDLNITSTPTFGGLTLGSLSGVLKATAGVISNGTTTDDLTEGKTNQYFTTARARSSVSAGTGITYNSTTGVITNSSPSSITSITGTANQIIVTGSGAITLSTPQNIDTSATPQFASLRESSIGTQNILLNGFNYVSSVGAGGNTLVGSLAGFNVGTGGKNIALGLGAMSGATATLTNSDGQNIAVGTASLNVITGIAQYNLAIGAYAGQNLTTSNYNIFHGYNSGNNVSTSSNNISIGNYSMGLGGTKLTNSTGANVCLGNYSGYRINDIAVSNTCIGDNAGNGITYGSNNIGIGSTSLGGVNGGSYNVAVGNNNLTGVTIGTYNVHLGNNTQGSAVSVSNEMVISAQSGTTVGKGTNTCFLNAPSGLYFTLPVLAQFPIINSTATVATSAGYVPYYSFQASTNGAVTYFNRGVTLTTTSASGGYWRFTQTGLYKITANMNIYISGASTTFVGSVATVGSTSGITNNGLKFWTSVGAGNTGWTLVTLVNVTNTALYYFLSEYNGIGINSSMNGCSSILIEMVSLN